jgi:hypothetical protein
MSPSNSLRGIGVALALCFAFTVSAGAADPPAPKPSGKWRIEFDHWSETEGELVLHIAPVTGDPVDVTTKIPINLRENLAAELVAGSLKGQLGGGYHVEVDDGEDVIVKVKGKTPKFVLSVASSTATGLKVKLKRS